MRLSLVSFNINGIRSFKGPLNTLLDQTDILCIQETKVNNHFDTVDFPNFHSFYSLPRLRKRVAYSGVATFVRHDSPYQITKTISDVEFLQDKTLDREGRVLVSFHANFLIVVNVYFVNKSPERYEFRRSFFARVIERVGMLAKDNSTSLIVLCGDFNITSAPIDHCDYSSTAGGEGTDDKSLAKLFYLEDPVRRELNSFFLHGDLLDTFREIYPTLREAYTCWNTKVSARDGNYGTRIDLITIVKNEAAFELKSAEILAHVMGSDHCPLRSVFEIADQKDKGAQDTEESEQATKKRKLQTSLKDFLMTNNSQQQQHQGPSSSLDTSVDANSLDLPDTAPRKKAKTTRITTFFETIPSHSIDKDQPLEDQREDVKPPNEITTTNWNDIFGKKSDVPLCHGHREPCKLLQVGKKGPNQGRYFYMCSRPVGNDPKVNQCNHFQWAKPAKSKLKK